MASSSIIHFLRFFFLSTFLSSTSFSSSSFSFNENGFLQCFHLHSIPSTNFSDIIYFPNTTSYSSVLLSSISNTRFASSSTSKPLLIITPTHESHIQASVLCCREFGLSLRVRSGGHDYEGLSYRSFNDQPFICVDLTNLRSVDVDIEHGMAWVQAGAILGDIYYNVANKSRTHGFPAGICPTVGVGGHISGGGMGFMVRKYGLAADNVLDVRLVDVHGRILEKKTMGEDLFWAIRGGGAVSFGVVVSWKIKLVPVPPTVTVFAITRSSKESTIELLNKWQQIADKLPDDLFIEAAIQATNNGTRAVEVVFNCLFLGESGELLQLIGEKFPELGAKQNDCKEMSWLESVKFFGFLPSEVSLEALTDRKLQPKGPYKAKSDFVMEPMPREAWEMIWSRFMEVDQAAMFLDPYGGRMAEISESAIPFPHRKGNLFNVQYVVGWSNPGSKAAKENIDWLRSLYKQMGPFVSKNPRAAYLNFRDFDLGWNEGRTTSYYKAKVWGRKYFKSNFRRLALVKGKVDPGNFFRNEQSIPPLLV